MGFKGYKVTRQLIEQAFTTGYSTDGLVNVVEGVPPGSRLMRIDYDFTKPVAIFWFEHESFEDSYYPADGGYVVVKTLHPPVF